MQWRLWRLSVVIIVLAVSLPVAGQNGTEDRDGDGLTDSGELAQGTDPDNRDTDADGLDDGQELRSLTNPLQTDTDADGVDDAIEPQVGTDPLNRDTDGDFLCDGDELLHGSDPLCTDTDADGIDDGVAMVHWSSPLAGNPAERVIRSSWTAAPDGSGSGIAPNGSRLARAPDGRVTWIGADGSTRTGGVYVPSTSFPTEGTGDIHNYDLDRQQSGFSHVDIDNSPLVMFLGWGMPPSPIGLPTAALAWTCLFGGIQTVGGIMPLAQGALVEGNLAIAGMGPGALTTIGNALLYLDSLAWNVSLPLEKDPVELDFPLSSSGVAAWRSRGPGLHINFRVSMPEPRLPHPSDFEADFDGTYAVVLYDAPSATARIYLAEGSVRLTTAASDGPRSFTGPDDDQTALLLLVGADGEIAEATVPLADLAYLVPPEFLVDDALESIVVTIPLAEPVLPGGETRHPVWHVMFDLDGNVATGLPPGTHATYTGLGVEFELTGFVDDLGQIRAEGMFNIGGDRLPAQAALSQDRRTVVLAVNAAALRQAAEARGYAFRPDAMRWRVASVDYAPPEQPKDVYPEVTYHYEPGIAPESPAEEPGSPAGTGPGAEAQPTGDACAATALQNANLRAGPGTNFALVGAVTGGDALAVIGQSAASDWYRLRVSGVDTAWIAGFLTTPPACPEGVTLAVVDQ